MLDENVLIEQLVQQLFNPFRFDMTAGQKQVIRIIGDVLDNLDGELEPLLTAHVARLDRMESISNKNFKTKAHDCSKNTTGYHHSQNDSAAIPLDSKVVSTIRSIMPYSMKILSGSILLLEGNLQSIFSIPSSYDCKEAMTLCQTVFELLRSATAGIQHYFPSLWNTWVQAIAFILQQELTDTDTDDSQTLGDESQLSMTTKTIISWIQRLLLEWPYHSLFSQCDSPDDDELESLLPIIAVIASKYLAIPLGKQPSDAQFISFEVSYHLITSIISGMQDKKQSVYLLHPPHKEKEGSPAATASVSSEWPSYNSDLYSSSDSSDDNDEHDKNDENDENEHLGHSDSKPTSDFQDTTDFFQSHLNFGCSDDKPLGIFNSPLHKNLGSFDKLKCLIILLNSPLLEIVCRVIHEWNPKECHSESKYQIMDLMTFTSNIGRYLIHEVKSLIQHTKDVQTERKATTVSNGHKRFKSTDEETDKVQETKSNTVSCSLHCFSSSSLHCFSSSSLHCFSSSSPHYFV